MKAFDDTDDSTLFEISVVNKANQAICIDCSVYNGEISFNKSRLIMQDGLKVSQKSWFDKGRQHNEYRGPQFLGLSEPLQDGLVEYLYSVGVRPEIGLVVEWLSWNKE